jgi:hypothetical protein
VFFFFNNTVYSFISSGEEEAEVEETASTPSKTTGKFTVL